MANVLTSNPIIIRGTQSSYKAAVATSLGSPFTLRIEKWYWENPAAAGDQVVITDPQDGSEKLRLRCELANQSQVIDWTSHPKLFSDFAVVEIDSGTLYVYTCAG